MRRLLDPVPLLLGGIVGALAGGAASYIGDGRIDWPLVLAILVAAVVTSLAVLIGYGPDRGQAWRRYELGPGPGGRWRYAGGRGPVGPFVPPSPTATEQVAPAGPGLSGGGGTFDRFDDTGKRVLALAQDEAIRFNHNYIGTEHILLGVLREGGVGAKALTMLGVEISKARTALEFIVGRGDEQTAPSDITLSPRTKKVIELAVDEARQLGHPYVGSGHVLLGLVREGEGIASGIIESLGVKLESVRQKVLELMAPLA